VTGCIGGDTTFLVFDILDYSVTDIAGYGSQVCQYEEKTVTISVANLGNQDRNNTTITVGLIIDGGTPSEQEATIAGVWSPGEGNAKDVVFNDPAVFNAVGTNDIKAYVKHEADIKNENDTLFDDILVNEAPVVDFGGDTIQVSLPYSLDPGEHNSYIWQNGFDGRYFQVGSSSDLYTVTVTDAGNPCPITKSVFVEPSASGIEDISDKMDLQLYPNPASEFLNIQLEVLNGEELYVEIYNIANQLVWSDYHDGFGTYNHKLDISSFNEGVYLLRFRNSEINHVQRIIIR
jgi:hypothetical protein